MRKHFIYYFRKCINIFAITAIFIACNNSSNPAPELPKIGVVFYNLEDSFIAQLNNSIADNAYNKATVFVTDSQSDESKQNECINYVIAQKVDSIAINMVTMNQASVEQIIEKVKNEKIPTIFFDREPHPEHLNKWDKAYYVGCKDEEYGTLQGEIAAEWWINNKGKNTTLKYVMLQGPPGDPAAELRSEYSIKAVKNTGINVEELAADTAMWDVKLAAEKMAEFLVQFGDQIDMVFCNNDGMAMGAITALENAGYFLGEKYMPVLGIDAISPALTAIENGKLLGTIMKDAKSQGKAIFDLAFDLSIGKSPSSSTTDWPVTDGKYIWVPLQKITRDNYMEFQ